MNEIHIDDLPPEMRANFLNKQMDVILEIIEQAGLLLEFQAFTESEEVLKIKSFDELCTEFAKKHPDKLFIVPTEDRYTKAFFCTSKYKEIINSLIEGIKQAYKECPDAENKTFEEIADWCGKHVIITEKKE